MSFSDYLEAKVLDLLFSNTAYTIPATLHIALFTVAPNTETGASGTEVTGGSYARAAVTNNTTNFPAASGGNKSNGTAINFITPTANWNTVVAVGIYDSSTAGNLLASTNLTTSKTINSGDGVSFPVGSLSFSLN